MTLITQLQKYILLCVTIINDINTDIYYIFKFYETQRIGLFVKIYSVIVNNLPRRRQ